MWAMAGQTTNAVIRRVVTSAVRKPIGLEANIAHSLHARNHHLRPRAMTRAAEIRYPFSVEPSRIQDLGARLVGFSFLEGRDVLSTWTVATFTGDAGNELLDLQT